MRYRTLGRTGLKISLLGFGTGGPSNLGQPANMPRSEQTALVHRCLDLGINLFDTASAYGHSEEILGFALDGVPRDRYILSTKWAHAPTWSQSGKGEADGTIETDAQVLVRSVENSLRLLCTDYLDILLLHGLRTNQYDEVVRRFWPELGRLQQAGKVRFIGFSERFIADPRHQTIVHGLQNHPDLWDVMMLKYGILNQYAAKEALPLAQQQGVGVLNMAAVRIKLPRPDQLEALIQDWKQRGLVPEDSLPKRDPLGWLVHDHIRSVIDAGYRFAADHPAVGSVLTGTADLSHLEQNAAAIEGPSLPRRRHRRVRLI